MKYIRLTICICFLLLTFVGCTKPFSVASDESVLSVASLSGDKTSTSLQSARDSKSVEQEEVNLPQRLFVTTNSQSSKDLRYDFRVENTIKLRVSVNTERGDISISIHHRDTKEVFFERKDYTVGTFPDEVELKPDYYAVVVTCKEHFGFYEVLTVA